jgi:hypothetical protein
MTQYPHPLSPTGHPPRHPRDLTQRSHSWANGVTHTDSSMGRKWNGETGLALVWAPASFGTITGTGSSRGEHSSPMGIGGMTICYSPFSIGRRLYFLNVHTRYIHVHPHIRHSIGHHTLHASACFCTYATMTTATPAATAAGVFQLFSGRPLDCLGCIIPSFPRLSPFCLVHRCIELHILRSNRFIVE